MGGGREGEDGCRTGLRSPYPIGVRRRPKDLSFVGVSRLWMTFRWVRWDFRPRPHRDDWSPKTGSGLFEEDWVGGGEPPTQS